MTAAAATEIEILETKLAEARRRVAPKTLAERLKAARSRRDSAAHDANRLASIVQKVDAELKAHAEAIKTRRAMGFPPPAPLKRVQFFSTQDASDGKREASIQMTPEEILADARARLSRAQSEHDTASREATALEAELAKHPVWKKCRAAFDTLREEFLLAAESGDALTDESGRKTLKELAGRACELESRSRGELMAAGLPNIRCRLSSEVWNFIPGESLLRDIDNFFKIRAAAIKRLKQTN